MITPKINKIIFLDACVSQRYTKACRLLLRVRIMIRNSTRITLPQPFVEAQQAIFVIEGRWGAAFFVDTHLYTVNMHLCTRAIFHHTYGTVHTVQITVLILLVCATA